MSDEEYEQKVTGLLERRFAAEVDSDPAAEAQWKQAAEVLHQGDHYILVMLHEAVGSRLKRWWQFWALRSRLIDVSRIQCARAERHPSPDRRARAGWGAAFGAPAGR